MNSNNSFKFPGQDIVTGNASTSFENSRNASNDSREMRKSISVSRSKRRSTLQQPKKLMTREGATGAEMDQERLNLKTYDYLCRIGEAKQWIEACIGEEIEPIEEMEEGLRNGVALALLANFLDPKSLKGKKIYTDKTRLHFKHIDNINFFYNATRTVGLPDIFLFETSDCYDKKNAPKVIYCLHALSHLCDQKGLGPKMQNLVGKLQFTDEQIEKTNQSLAEQGIQLPEFSDVGKALAKELNEVEEETEEQRRSRYLEENSGNIVRAQALARGYLARKAYKQDRARVVRCQAEARKHLQQQRYRRRLSFLNRQQAPATRIQAFYRGYTTRRAYLEKLARYRSNAHLIAKLQATWRAKKQREQFKERQQYWKNNVDAVSAIQRLFRARRQKDAFQRLLNLANIDVTTLSSFKELMDDSQIDFDEELENDRLRHLVISKIRENHVLEGEVNELDVKIALLVSNRMTLEEVVHTTTKQAKKAEIRREGARQAFSLKALNKENRDKLLHYQELFYLLQTEPRYLARLMHTLSATSASNLQKAIENVVIALFAYAQNPREEYLFLELIKQSIALEVENASSVSSITTGNPLFFKLVLQYTRGAKDQQYLKELIGPAVRSLISQSNISLDTDPVSIYKRLIQEKELNTGQKSSRKYDVTPKEAFADLEVQQIYQQNATKLIEVAESFLSQIVSSAELMPFGIRSIANELRTALLRKFPSQRDEVTKAIGNLLYYRYMNTGIVSPDLFDVVEGSISPQQRKNLAEVSKLLNHIASGRQQFIEPELLAGISLSDSLGAYAASSYPKFQQFIRQAIDVCNPKEYFGIDDFIDLAKRSKPTIVINLTEIATVHRALLDNLVQVCQDDPTDPMRTILQDLGPVPEFPEDDRSKSAEIVLTLVNRFAALTESSEDIQVKELFLTTKKYITALVKIATGRKLTDVLETFTTQRQEQTYLRLIEDDRQKFNTQQAILLKCHNGQVPNAESAEGETNKRFTLPPASQNGSVSNGPLSPVAAYVPWPSSLAALKRQTLESLAQLEQKGLVSKSNDYSAILTAIAKDILNRHKRRTARRKECLSLQRTLEKLNEKGEFLNEQKGSYNDYVQTCMQNLAKGNAKKQNKPLPFSKHWAHYQETHKKGEGVPKFGSFKYTAADLYKKGVLVSIDNHSPREYGRITLTISSNEPGVFNIAISLLGIPYPYKPTIHLEDLLQSQFAGTTIVPLFDGAKVNVNLLLYLLNKKFYA